MKDLLKRIVHRLFSAGGFSDLSNELNVSLQRQSQKTDLILEKLQIRDFRLDELKEKVSHVEKYQPIYGVTGVINDAQRSSKDRCTAINAYFKGSVRGLRMLDVGSSLGYVCFYFADRGATTTGWELSPKNSEVTRLASEINGIKTSIKTKKLDLESVQTIEPGAYDVVTILSVIHHIIHHQGLENTKRLMKELLNKTPVLIVELAKKGEDKSLFWDKSQPANELEIFDLVKDTVTITKIGEFGNHLSDNLRPLYVVSKKKQITVNDKIYAYEKSTNEAYDFSPSATDHSEKRKYYQNTDTIIKEYKFGPHGSNKNTNAKLIINEINTLMNTQSVYNSPQLVDFELNSLGAKIVLKKISGNLLSELGKMPQKDVKNILKDILRSLIDLEAIGLHHNDVRTWNVLYDGKRASLIDYGQCSPLVVDDDAVALLWLIESLHNGGRESTEMNKKSVPSLDRLPSFTKKLREEVVSGERSFKKLEMSI